MYDTLTLMLAETLAFLLGVTLTYAIVTSRKTNKGDDEVQSLTKALIEAENTIIAVNSAHDPHGLNASGCAATYTDFVEACERTRNGMDDEGFPMSMIFKQDTYGRFKVIVEVDVRPNVSDGYDVSVMDEHGCLTTTKLMNLPEAYESYLYMASFYEDEAMREENVKTSYESTARRSRA